MIDRRKLITGLISFVAAPAIVRAESLMKVKALNPSILRISDYKFIGVDYGLHDFVQYGLMWYDPVECKMMHSTMSPEEFWKDYEQINHS